MSSSTLAPIRTTLATLCLLAFPMLATVATAQTRLVVDLSERQLYAYSGDKLVRTYGVAIGLPNHPTPTGSFSIGEIIWNPGWTPPDADWAKKEIPRRPGDPKNPMRGVKLIFKGPLYYIHGTNAPSSIGEAASHGCIRMVQSDAEDLAEMVQKAGGADYGDAWFERVRGSSTDTHSVGLPHAIPLTIRP